MQRVLVLITLLGLVFASLALGALASNWPFWSRAVAWQRAGPPWPEPASLRGPWQVFEPGRQAAVLQVSPDPALDELAQSLRTEVLLVGTPERVRAHFMPGHSAHSPVDGRGLAALLPTLLLGTLGEEWEPLLDTPMERLFVQWREDPRGAITPRQLLWQLGGLPAGPFRPLNPFSAQAMLRSGPDFRRAALSIEGDYPPGSHFEAAPVNAQLLALVAEQQQQRPYAQLLQERLWGDVAALPARGLLDHRRGMLAAHCCFVAAAEDWLRLGLLVAGHGHTGAGGMAAARGGGAGAADAALLPATYLAELVRQSPVHPGQGLGFEVQHDAAGRVLLILQSAGRLLAALPGRGRALFWSGGELTGAARQRLLEELAR